jgi:glycosyltransferase domain-containing protein
MHAAAAPIAAVPMADGLDDHTVVIPTYNRPELLARLIAYLVGRTGSMSLLILDSSAPDIAAVNSGTLAPQGERVRHMAFPTTMPMAAKLSAGLAHVTTPTASFCADDDIVFPDGLREALSRLRNQPDHVSAHGLYLNFGEHGHDIHLMSEYAGASNDAAHPGARIFKLCQHYESLFYGVFRTDDLKDIFSQVAQIPTLHYQELFQSVAALIKGKVERFPSFFAARRSGPAAEPAREKWQTYYWFAENPAEFLAHYAEYRSRLADFFESRSLVQLQREQVLKLLDITHAMYFSRGSPPAYFHSVLEPLWPGDRFVRQNVDLLHAMRPAGRRAAIPAGIRRAFKRLSRLRGGPRPTSGDIAAALAALDRHVATAGSVPWKCRLRPGIEWLVLNEDFCTSYQELCRYLDGPADRRSNAV